MATYPTLPTGYGADPAPINAIDIDRAEDGTARARSFYATDKFKISIDHPDLTAAQKAVLDAFYSTNRLLAFDYVSVNSGLTYSCLFTRAPAYTYIVAGHWSARVDVEQV